MRRKILKDFANVLCQKFADLPSGRDLVVFVKLQMGIVTINVLTGECKFGDLAIEPLRICSEHKAWLEQQVAKHHMLISDLKSVSMTVEFRVSDVVLRESYGHDFRHANFWFGCSSEIQTDEATYLGTSVREKRWSYGHYWQELLKRDSQ